jgi:hypothetical protein
LVAVISIAVLAISGEARQAARPARSLHSPTSARLRAELLHVIQPKADLDALVVMNSSLDNQAEVSQSIINRQSLLRGSGIAHTHSGTPDGRMKAVALNY